MNAGEHDVLAYMALPRQHRTKWRSTTPIECLNKEVKRRADVIGIYPNEAFAQIDKEEINPILSMTTKAA